MLVTNGGHKTARRQFEHVPREFRYQRFGCDVQMEASSAPAASGGAGGAALSAGDRAYKLDEAKLEAVRRAKPWLSECVLLHEPAMRQLQLAPWGSMPGLVARRGSACRPARLELSTRLQPEALQEGSRLGRCGNENGAHWLGFAPAGSTSCSVRARP